MHAGASLEALLRVENQPKTLNIRQKWGARRNLFKRRTGSALYLEDVAESQSILERLAGGSDLESRAVGSDFRVVESRMVELEPY